MRKSKHDSVFTGFYCTSIVLTLIFFSSCSGATYTQTKQEVPILTTETETVVRKPVENPETGVYEMRVVSKTHTKTHTRMTENNVPLRPPNAHTNAGHSAEKKDDDWEFYALSLLIMALSLYVVSN